jgi:hypothetical protein
MSLRMVSRAARRVADHLRVLDLLAVERGLQQQLTGSQDSVHRGPDLVAHVGEKLGLCGGGALGLAARPFGHPPRVANPQILPDDHAQHQNQDGHARREQVNPRAGQLVFVDDQHLVRRRDRPLQVNGRQRAIQGQVADLRADGVGRFRRQRILQARRRAKRDGAVGNGIVDQPDGVALARPEIVHRERSAFGHDADVGLAGAHRRQDGGRCLPEQEFHPRKTHGGDSLRRARGEGQNVGLAWPSLRPHGPVTNRSPRRRDVHVRSAFGVIADDPPEVHDAFAQCPIRALGNVNPLQADSAAPGGLGDNFDPRSYRLSVRPHELADLRLVEPNPECAALEARAGAPPSRRESSRRQKRQGAPEPSHAADAQPVHVPHTVVSAAG